MDWTAEEISVVTSQTTDKEEGSWRGLCLTGARGSSSPCLEKDPRIAKYSESVWHTELLRSKLTRRSPSQGIVQCAQHPRDPEGLFLRFPKQIGKTVNRANAVLTHRDESCSSSVWHQHCFLASRTGRGSHWKNSCSVQSVPQLPSHSARDTWMQEQEHLFQPVGDEIDFQTQALCRKWKEQSRCQAVCSKALPLCPPLWSNNSFKGEEGRKNSHPAVC